MSGTSAPRGNKARNDKSSIVADTKNLLSIMHPAIQRMPKIERIEGAPVEFKAAAYGIIRCFYVAKECPEVRLQKIHEMLGYFGVLVATFELMIKSGILAKDAQMPAAIRLERIEEGVKKWRNATRNSKSQEQQQVAGKPEEVTVSYL